MKHPNQKGPSKKNTVFIKRGLTWEEMERVDKATKDDRNRWIELMAKPLNKYKPTDETPKRIC